MRREFRERLLQQYRTLLVDAAKEGIDPLEFNWGLTLLQSMVARDTEASEEGGDLTQLPIQSGSEPMEG